LGPGYLAAWSLTLGACQAPAALVVQPGGPAQESGGAQMSELPPPSGALPPASDDEAEVEVLEGPGEPAVLLRRPRGRPLSINARMQQRCRQHRGAIERASAQTGTDPLLLLAIAWIESGFNPFAESPAGARGILQLVPRTSAHMGCRDPGDPYCAGIAAAAYLKWLLRQFDGRLVYALCAYHSGHVAPMRAFRAGVLPNNVGYAHRVLEARSRLQRFGCDGR